jgi:hypothetical protein
MSGLPVRSHIKAIQDGFRDEGAKSRFPDSTRPECIIRVSRVGSQNKPRFQPSAALTVLAARGE